MINDLMSADPSAEGGDLRNIYKVGLNTTRLLMVLGDVVCAWLLLRQAEIALEKLGGDAGPGARTRPSTRARSPRRSSSRRPMLPRISAERAIAEATDLSVMDLSEDAF